MGAREMERFLERWQLDVDDVLRRMYLAPTPRERERWHALWLLARGWTAGATAGALGRDPHTIGRWLSAFGNVGAEAERELDAYFRFYNNQRPHQALG